MKTPTHQQQQEIWDKEHAAPQVLLQMDSTEPSFGVIKFWRWLEKTKVNLQGLKGLEMGCGKGRNVIWLAQQGATMTGFDFSPNAIIVAKNRAEDTDPEKIIFIVHDATIAWPFSTNTFDFTIDCFATTDIESETGRQFAIAEMKRVTKPDGYLLVYVLSTDDAFHKEMITHSPASENNAFLHPTGKFEKVFTSEELKTLYSGLKLIVEERIPKIAVFNGKEYACNHHWMVFRK